MTLKASDIINLPVVSIDNGKKITTVNDIIYSPQNNKIEALLIDPGGWFSDAKVIMISDLKSIGPDAVIIDSEEVIKKVSDVQTHVADVVKNDNYLTGKKVITENGEDLGQVTDLLFDPTSGQVEALEISQGAFQNIKSGKKAVKVDNIVTIGEDNLIVQGSTVYNFKEQSQSRGLKGTLNQASDSLSQKIQDLKDSPKTQTLVDNTKQKARDIKEATQQKARGIKEGASEKSEELEYQAKQAQNSPQTQNIVDAAKLELERAKKSIQYKANETQQEIEKRAEEYRRTHPEEDDTKQ